MLQLLYDVYSTVNGTIQNVDVSSHQVNQNSFSNGTWRSIVMLANIPSSERYCPSPLAVVGASIAPLIPTFSVHVVGIKVTLSQRSAANCQGLMLEFSGLAS